MAEDTYIQRSSDCNQCYCFKILISSHSLAFYRLSRSRLALRLFLHTLEGYLCSKKQTRVVLDFLDYSFPSPFSLKLRITRERRFRDVHKIAGQCYLQKTHTKWRGRVSILCGEAHSLSRAKGSILLTLHHTP